MNITQIKYVDPEHTQVRITYDDGRVTTGDKQQLINREYISESDTIAPWMTTAEKKEDARKTALATVNSKRKQAEKDGVTINGIRYAGNRENRQTIDEAVRFAESAGMTVFASWKDSDNGYHYDHPVSDVSQALNSIAVQRGALIAQEAQAVTAIMAATKIADIKKIADEFLEVQT